MMLLSRPPLDDAKSFSHDIQILRGVAVIMTFFAHVPGVYPQFSKILFFHFWTGVDLFFVISGYVISRSFFPDIALHENRIDKIRLSISFWIKRIYRLFPASAFWAIFLLCCSIFFNASGIFATWRDVLTEVVSFFLYSKNIASVYGINFSLGPYWSLSLEEQFYFLLPFFLIFLPKLLRPVFIVPLALFLGAFSNYLGPHYHLFRFEYFLVGIFIYQVRSSEINSLLAPIFLNKLLARVVFIIVFLMIMMLSPSIMSFMPGHKIFVLISAGLLVFAASYGDLIFRADANISILLRWIGDRSYSFYLSHLAALLLVYEISFRLTGLQLKTIGWKYALLMVSVSFVLTMIFAMLSWRILELPMQKLGRRRSKEYLIKTQGN